MRRSITTLLLTVVAFVSVLPAFSFSQVSAQNLYRGLVVRLPGEDDFYIDFINVKPGDSLNGSFIVQHEFIEENTPATIYLYAADFEVGDDGATAIEPKDGRFLDSEYSIAKHVVFDKDKVTLPKYGDKETISFSVQVPLDAQPGLRYTRVLASGVDPGLTTAEQIAQNTGAGVKSRITVATLLISIGDQSQFSTSGELASVSLRDIEGNRGIFGWLFDLSPLTAVVSIKNTGNQALLPGGNITWHGGDPSNPYDFQKFNESRHRILPGKTRSFFNTWQDGIMFAQRNSEGTIEYSWDLQGELDPKWGKHFVDVRINYKDSDGNSKFLLETVEFWLLPWKALLVLIVLILLVIVYFRYRRSFRKNSNKKSSSGKQKK